MDNGALSTADPAGVMVTQARHALALLQFDAERCNERSALVLLALLGLRPGMAWLDASDPMLRTVAIMEFLREVYGKDYKPNSRETIRRFTLHQFAEALLIEQNPDQPDRPVNSPKWCYQINIEALRLLRTFEDSAFPQKLARYLLTVPSLKETYIKARKAHRVPVTLPSGMAITLSAGGQNLLIKQIIEEFCSIYTPGGQVLYVGDADSKWQVFERNDLASLGVSVDEHGKMPDLVVHLVDKNWLVLIEAVSSHGPVDSKRHAELAKLFSGSTAGLVYVSCFSSRVEMRRFLSQLAWETDAWCADSPTHLIHFNGERFLGPYGVPSG